MKKSNYTIVLFLMTVLVVSAQQTGSIKGGIKNKFGEILPNITCTLEGTSKGGISDQEGIFLFERVPFGAYVLVFQHLNYSSIRKKIILSENEPILNLNITMFTKAFDLQLVEITGRELISYRDQSSFDTTKTATKIIDIPQSLSIVTKEVLSDQESFIQGDIAKNLSGVNSVSFYDAFTFRGFELSSETRSLINGLHTVGFFGSQPLLVNIERVEVIKGFDSALYGDANPGGTMNSVTKKPLSEERKSVSFTTGSYSTKRVSLDFTESLSESKLFLYRLNLGYENSDDFRNLQENKSYVIASCFSFLPDKNMRVNVELVWTKQEGELDRGLLIDGAFGPNPVFDLSSAPTSLAINKVNDFYMNTYDYINASLSQKITHNITFNTSYLHFNWEEDLQEYRTANGFARNNSFDEFINNKVALRPDLRQRELSSYNITPYFLFNDISTCKLKHKILIGYDYVQQKEEAGGSQLSADGYRLINGGIGSFVFEDQADFDANSGDFLFENDGVPVPNVPHFNLDAPVYELADLTDYNFNKAFNFPVTKYFPRGIYVLGSNE